MDNYRAHRAEIVRVSKAYTVLSRATAFLVLENERMYKEFGVKRNRNRTNWQGGPVNMKAGRDQPEDAKQDRGEAEAQLDDKALSRDHLNQRRPRPRGGCGEPEQHERTPGCADGQPRQQVHEAASAERGQPAAGHDPPQAQSTPPLG